MISGRLDLVFSGGDNDIIVTPLPLAFLRLIESGVYTYEIDWRDSSWESQSPTSEQEAIIEGALNEVVYAIEGKPRTMQFIDQLTVTLFSETFVMVDGYQIGVTPSLLPEDAQKATGVYLEVVVNLETANRPLKVVSISGKAQQFFLVTTANVNNRFHFLAPMNGEGFYISVAADVGDSVTWSCRLIGWMR